MFISNEKDISLPLHCSLYWCPKAIVKTRKARDVATANGKRSLALI
jgi:hypothetical protein